MDSKGKLSSNADNKHIRFLGVLHEFKNCWTVPSLVLEMS